MVFRFTQRVPARIEALFRFHERPANLALLLRGWPGFRLLHHDDSILPGATVWFEQVVAQAVPVVLGFRHTSYEPPVRFEESLIHGPFERFTHLHEFEAEDDYTVLHDTLDVELPWQYGGTIGCQLIVSRVLRAVFAHRRVALDSLLAAGSLAGATDWQRS